MGQRCIGKRSGPLCRPINNVLPLSRPLVFHDYSNGICSTKPRTQYYLHLTGWYENFRPTDPSMIEEPKDAAY